MPHESRAMERKESGSAGPRWQETQRGFPGPTGDNTRCHTIQAQAQVQSLES